MHVFLVLAIKFWEISSMEGREEGGGEDFKWNCPILTYLCVLSGSSIGAIIN